MNRKGKGRGVFLQLFFAMPILTILLALLGAKLILSEVISEGAMQWCACIITGIVSFLLCLYTALRMPQKKFLWGLLTAAAYCCLLLLGNLLFFGVGYGNIPAVVMAVFGGGLFGSLLGAGKRRKFA